MKDRMTIGEIVGAFATGEPPLRIEAYDGSAVGPADGDLVLHLKSEKALQYIITAPGDLGLARVLAGLGHRDPERWRPWRAYAAQYLWATLDHPINRLPKEHHEAPHR